MSLLTLFQLLLKKHPNLNLLLLLVVEMVVMMEDEVEVEVEEEEDIEVQENLEVVEEETEKLDQEEEEDEVDSVQEDPEEREAEVELKEGVEEDEGPLPLRTAKPRNSNREEPKKPLGKRDEEEKQCNTKAIPTISFSVLIQLTRLHFTWIGNLMISMSDVLDRIVRVESSGFWGCGIGFDWNAMEWKCLMIFLGFCPFFPRCSFAFLFVCCVGWFGFVFVRPLILVNGRGELENPQTHMRQTRIGLHN